MDILADNGQVLAAVARRKDGSLQYLEHEGAAFELACACARVMKADGLVNVQTRHDHHGQPLLLEINMRPSGGIGYTALSGVNLRVCLPCTVPGCLVRMRSENMTALHFVRQLSAR